ncbi:major facilitator superfamily domain-containing protein [Lipomyces oligophaga]|uniref:major facilitator superfamily domain-containing protein n=1 Tax=Lipomyces oligophaga TaxID=45792 RepID=UPI0034CF7AE8
MTVADSVAVRPFVKLYDMVRPKITVTGAEDYRGIPVQEWNKEDISIRFASFIDEANADYTPNMFQKFLGQFWDTFTLPPKKRRYMQKLDANILLYCLLSFFIKTLDNSNISNAYVSGMQKALHLYGNERNLFTTFFNIGYLIGCVPAQFMLSYVRPSIWIPTCEFIWSGLVMSISGCSNAHPIYGIRFLIGFFEAVAYPGLAMVLGSWYLPHELGKRMELYDVAWAIASMFSGYIQIGVYEHMNGLAGFAGWQWLFIIDGIISFPISWLGFYSIPDFPINTRVIWMTELEKEYSYVRMQLAGRKQPKKMTLMRFIDIFKTWRPYGFLIPWCLFNINDTTGYFSLWLDSLPQFSTPQVNAIPTGGYAISLVMGYGSANLSDRLGGYRWAFILHGCAWCFLGNLLLAIWNIPYGLKFFAFFCPDIGYSTWGMMLAWSAEVFQDDAELRGMLPAIGSTISYAINAWLPVVIFPSYKAPHYSCGYQIITGLLGVEFMGVLFMLYMSKREARLRGRVINEYGLAVDVEDSVALRDYQISDVDSKIANNKDVEAGNVTIISALEPRADSIVSSEDISEKKDKY